MTTNPLGGAREGRRPRFDWPEAVERHGLTVLARLQAEGLSWADAHEYAQAAWVRLFERYQHVPVEQLKLPGLVIVVARNLFIDDYRRQLKRQEAEAPLSEAGAHDPARLHECRTLLESVNEQLARIGGRDSDIFWAVVVEERGVDDVAAEFGLRRSQTYAVVARVRSKLKRRAFSRE